MIDLSLFVPSNLLYTYPGEHWIAGYRPGGYHPVTLGDTFKDGRYKVYQKAGLRRLCDRLARKRSIVCTTRGL